MDEVGYKCSVFDLTDVCVCTLELWNGECACAQAHYNLSEVGRDKTFSKKLPLFLRRTVGSAVSGVRCLFQVNQDVFPGPSPTFSSLEMKGSSWGIVWHVWYCNFGAKDYGGQGHQFGSTPWWSLKLFTFTTEDLSFLLLHNCNRYTRNLVFGDVPLQLKSSFVYLLYAKFCRPLLWIQFNLEFLQRQKMSNRNGSMCNI